MQRTVLVFATTALLLVLPAAAHGPAPPRAMETRLLEDCVDDYYGADDNRYGRAGYELHNLDVREAWSQALGDHLVFRIILNLDGDPDDKIVVAFKAGGASKSFEFTGGGTAWSGTFDKVTYVPPSVIQDGERFALEGSIKRSTLGIGVGGKLTDYTVVGMTGSTEHDKLPSNDHPAPTACTDSDSPTNGYDEQAFKRPDYTLKGPVQYVSSTFQENGVSVPVGQEAFVTLTIKNLLADTFQTAEVTVASDKGNIRLHDPATNKYVTKATMDLDKKGRTGDTQSIHVAVAGDAPTSGKATVTITTAQGARITDTLDFTITSGATTTTTTTTTDEPGEDSPGLPVIALLVLLAWAARRR